MIKSLDEFINITKKFNRKKVSVAVAEDENVLHSVCEANKLGLIDAILVGNKEKILSIADKIGEDISNFEIIKELNSYKAAKISVDLVSSGEANILMKGKIMTSELLKIVLDKSAGLRTERVLSHVSIFELETYHKLLILTDCALNIQPDLKRKADIIQNAVDVARAIGVGKPKVAINIFKSSKKDNTKS